jgi:hypothetical protein
MILLHILLTFLVSLIITELLITISVLFLVGYNKKTKEILNIPKDNFYFYFKNLRNPNLYFDKNNLMYINKLPSLLNLFFKYYHSEYGIIFTWTKEHKYIDEIYKSLKNNEKV